MKKIFSLFLGLILLSGFAVAERGIFKIPDPIELPENPVPREIDLIDIFGSKAQSYGTSTQRYVKDYRITMEIIGNFMVLRNIGTEESYDFVLYQTMQYEQPTKYYISPMKPRESLWIYMQTKGYIFYLNFWN